MSARVYPVYPKYQGEFYRRGFALPLIIIAILIPVIILAAWAPWVTPNFVYEREKATIKPPCVEFTANSKNSQFIGVGPPSYHKAIFGASDFILVICPSSDIPYQNSYFVSFLGTTHKLSSTPNSSWGVRSTVSTPDETVYPDQIGANWKTYTNEKLGFSLKYPPSVTTDFVAFDGGAGGNNVLGLKGPNYRENTDFGSGMAIWASNTAGSDPKTVAVIDRQSIKQNEAAGFGQNFDLSCAIKEIKIGNSTTALLQTCNKIPAHFIYIQNSKGIIVRLTTLSAGSYQPLIDQILSTFKFLD